MNTKEQALELQELLGDEFMVRPWVVDYTWDAITISKGGKEIRIFTRDLTQVVKPNGLWEYVESEAIPH